MAEEAAAGGEGGGEGAPAATTATEESTDMGFYNRKLHNYPLIKVCTVRSMPMYMIVYVYADTQYVYGDSAYKWLDSFICSTLT